MQFFLARFNFFTTFYLSNNINDFWNWLLFYLRKCCALKGIIICSEFSDERYEVYFKIMGLGFPGTDTVERSEITGSKLLCGTDVFIGSEKAKGCKALSAPLHFCLKLSALGKMVTAGDKQIFAWGVGISGLEEEIFVQQRCCQKPYRAGGWVGELRRITDHIVESRDIGLHRWWRG